MSRQCELLGLARSTWYFTPASESPENLELMRAIDEQYMKTPFYGSRRMAVCLGEQRKEFINRKRVQRLMRVMGLEAIYPKPLLSLGNAEHRIFPYLLRNVEIVRPNQVWSTDITFIPLTGGYLYLVAVIDWYSRYVLSWRLSNTLDTLFCLQALEDSLQINRPEIFNTDQGVQFTSLAFTSRLEQAGVSISMDGRGRAIDNVFVERLWRSVKYEDVYIKSYSAGRELHEGLDSYFSF